jgi:voltage-gated potassium channel
MKWAEFTNLPWLELSDDRARSRFGNNKIAEAAIDILDDDLWGSKISIIGNSIIMTCILLGATIYILTNGNDLTGISPTLSLIELVIGFLVTIEVVLRIRFARFLGFSNARFPILSYLFSFIGIVDFLSMLSFLSAVTGFEIGESLISIQILRLWRITRYIPAFRGVSDAFKSRKDEIIVTMLAVVLLSLTFSAIMYHAEKSAGSNSFSGILEVFIWSIGKYTGDYGAIAGAVPLSVMGKIIATINGLLGIALFAIPAGLLASAFIDQLSELRKSKEIKERYIKIANHFDKSVGGGKHFKFKANSRFFSFDTLQAKFVFSDEQLFEAIRESPRLRFRAMKSSPELRYNDTRIVESFKHNNLYGYSKIEPDASILVVNPIGEIERGISHFATTIGQSLPVSLLSREKPIHQGEAKVGTNKSMFYSEYLTNESGRFSLPLVEFMRDVNSIKKEGLIFIISSAASGRSDLVLEYGNKLGETDWNKDTTTFNDSSHFNKVINILKQGVSKVQYRSQSEKNIESSFSIEEGTIGNIGNDSLLRNAHKLTGADVITIYVNINILIGPDEKYYSLLSAICGCIEEINVLYSKKIIAS